MTTHKQAFTSQAHITSLDSPFTIAGVIHSHGDLHGLSGPDGTGPLGAGGAGTSGTGGRAPPGPAARRRDEKRCAVCGDHAVGYNFGAIACESCKAFFRRNALRMSVGYLSKTKLYKK